MIRIPTTTWLGLLALCLAGLGCGGETPPSEDGGADYDAGAPTDGGSPCPEEPCELDLPSVQLVNPSDVARTEVARATLPLPPGTAANAAQLGRVTVDGEPAELVPIKWHLDPETGLASSVALAQLRWRTNLAPGAEVTLQPTSGGAAPEAFAVGPEAAAWLAGRREGATVRVTLPGGRTLSAPLVTDTPMVLDEGVLTQTMRHRAHFSDDDGAHPLALTVYMTLDAGMEHGELVVLIGNDTLEQPVSGGIDISRIEVEVAAPFRFGVRMPSASGITPPADGDDQTWVLLGEQLNLADGANLVFRGRWAVTPQRSGAEYDSFRAATDSPLVGIASYESWRDSRAAGAIGWLAPPSADDATRQSEAAAECGRTLEGTPVSHLGVINRAPPSTGDQVDFASSVPVFMRQVMETGSACPLHTAWLATDREGLRPSYYWMTRDGAEDRVRSTDFPRLFFWNGRMHFDPSWNREYTEWLSRASYNGFETGDTHRWSGMDAQHYGNNGLRAAYELTGDPYLGELLVAHQTLLTWLFFTRYEENLDSLRAMRLMKEALALYTLFPDTPTAPVMRDGAIAKNLVVLAEVERRVANDLSPGYGTVSDDGRVELTQRFPGEEVVVGWQSGFLLEYQAYAARSGWDPDTADAIISHFFDHIPAFFLEDGTPVTYYLESDPSERTLGGITDAWWAGWIHALERAPMHPRASRLDQEVRAEICRSTRADEGDAYDGRQRWESFECP